MYKHKIVIFLGFSLISLNFVALFPIENKLVGICERVIDGDTVIVNGEKIRLAGIDAPELKQKSFDGQKIGKISQRYLEKLILAKKIEIINKGRGYYGRVIGEIFYQGKNINLKLLAMGMVIKSDFNQKRIYKNTQYVARLNRRGIFGTEGFQAPWRYRRSKNVKAK